jgi:hypothetical protein
MPHLTFGRKNKLLVYEPPTANGTHSTINPAYFRLGSYFQIFKIEVSILFNLFVNRLAMRSNQVVGVVFPMVRDLFPNQF